MKHHSCRQDYTNIGRMKTKSKKNTQKKQKGSRGNFWRANNGPLMEIWQQIAPLNTNLRQIMKHQLPQQAPESCIFLHYVVNHPSNPAFCTQKMMQRWKRAVESCNWGIIPAFASHFPPKRSIWAINPAFPCILVAHMPPKWSWWGKWWANPAFLMPKQTKACFWLVGFSFLEMSLHNLIRKARGWKPRPRLFLSNNCKWKGKPRRGWASPFTYNNK